MRSRIAFLCFCFSLSVRHAEGLALVGEVNSYQRGKSIEIVAQPAVDKTFDLTTRVCKYLIDPDIVVGSKVEVEETIDKQGHKVVFIRPAASNR